MTRCNIFDTWRDDVVVKVEKDSAELYLRRWLEGDELPKLDSYTEGHSWLLEAVRETSGLKTRLAVLSAKLIESHLAGRLESGNLPRLLFNLLYLSAELREPLVLWDPLFHMLNARSVPEPNNGVGDYQGVTLIAALRAALIGNQLPTNGSDSPALLPVWCAMLEGRPDPYLRGAPMDGLEGVMALPGEPKEVLVGWALARMCDDLDDNPVGRSQFKQLLGNVKCEFKNQQWDFELLAARCEWKPWAQRMVGSPGKLVSIRYAEIPKVEYLKGTRKPRIRIRLPLRYKADAANFEPTIRQVALDFCKDPPADGILVPLIEHLLPSTLSEAQVEVLDPNEPKTPEPERPKPASFAGVRRSFVDNQKKFLKAG